MAAADIVTRRAFILTGALALPRSRRTLATAFTQMERTNGGRLGVAVFDTGSGEHAGYRENERFPMCSTFKFLLASAVLRRVDRGQEMLDRAVRIPAKPLLSNSPLTEPHAGDLMTVAELCHAALTRSDNTAANLLLETIGGPPAIAAFCRSIGDTVTRLDRTELALNQALVGDARDTTSPAAMVGNLKRVLLKDVLRPTSRDRLTQWMQGNLTGLDRLRANLPDDWRSADKTGSNGEHTSNDIAVLWPAGKPPIIVAAYITQCMGPESKRAAMLAQIGKLARK